MDTDRPLYPRIDAPEKQPDGTYLVRVRRAPGDDDAAPAKTLAAAREMVRFLERAAVLLTPKPKPPTERGRPSKLTPELIEDMCNLIRRSPISEEDAAALLGVGRSHYLWKQKGREAKSGKYWDYVQALQAARLEVKQRLLRSVIDAGQLDGKMAMIALERLFPHEFARRIVLHEGEPTGPLPEFSGRDEMRGIVLGYRRGKGVLEAHAEEVGDGPAPGSNGHGGNGHSR